VITVLNVYKPRGLTPYGRRKQLAVGGQGDAISTATITCLAGACVTTDPLNVHSLEQLRSECRCVVHAVTEHACGIGAKWWSTVSNSTPLS